jgi:hypothetical protein
MNWKIGDVTIHKVVDLMGGGAGVRALAPRSPKLRYVGIGV